MYFQVPLRSVVITSDNNSPVNIKDVQRIENKKCPRLDVIPRLSLMLTQRSRDWSECGVNQRQVTCSLRDHVVNQTHRALTNQIRGRTGFGRSRDKSLRPVRQLLVLGQTAIDGRDRSSNRPSLLNRALSFLNHVLM